MMPYTDSAPKMTITSIVIDAGGNARVCWSEQSNSTALARGATVTHPGGAQGARHLADHGQGQL